MVDVAQKVSAFQISFWKILCYSLIPLRVVVHSQFSGALQIA